MLWCCAVLAACAHEPVSPPAPELTWAGVAFELPQDSVTVPFDPRALKGKVVLLTFVTSWCFPCLTDLVTLDKLQRDYGARGFQNVLVAVNIDGRKVLEPFAELRHHVPAVGCRRSIA